MASKSISELPTYTAGFDVTDVTQQEKHFDERENARFLAERFGTQHNEIVITQVIGGAPCQTTYLKRYL